MSGPSRQQALEEVARLAKQHSLSISEITKAIEASASPAAESVPQSAHILVRMLSYMGGILILSGLVYYIGTFWNGMGSYARVIITFGPGAAAFLMGLAALGDARYTKAVAPLFLVAAILQPTGIAVTMREFFEGDNPHFAVFMIAGAMTLQFGGVFYQWRQEVLLWCFGLFFTILVGDGLEWMGFSEKLAVLVTSASMISIAYGFRNSDYPLTLGWAYFFGSIGFLISSFQFVEGTSLEITYVLFAAAVMYLSSMAKSRAMLIVGALGLFSYITYFSGKHIANSLGWALVLILLGILFLLLSGAVIKLSKKFTRV